jgi:DNA-binding CsgD family transcriptional regulator
MEAVETRFELAGVLRTALEVTPAVPRPEPLAALESHVARAREEQGLVLVAGEPGAGKTRLVAELSARAAERGETVLYGRCDARALIPYEPFVDALRAARATGAVAGPSPAHRPYLARILPELADEEVTPAPSGDEADRLLLFDAVARTLGGLAPRRPLLLVVEDLHWAEPSTLLLLRYLLRDPAAPSIAIVGTMRAPDPDRGGSLPDALAELRRRHPVHEVHLEGLDADAVAELVTAWRGAPAPPSLIERLRDYTSGNPFYLRSTLRELGRSGGGDSIDPDGRLPVPEDVRELAMRRSAALGEAPRALLQAGAILGREFVIEEARLAARLGPDEAVEAGELATAAGMVHQVDSVPVRLAFEHALVRLALVEATSPSRRALLHRRAAEAIEAVGAPDTRTAELALHYGFALTAETAPSALRYARLAAAQARDQYAFEEQTRQLELARRALAAIADHDPLEEYDLLMQLGLARYRAGGPDNSHGAFVAAAELAERLGDAQRMGRAALGAGFERYLRQFGRVEQDAVELIGRALRSLGGESSALTTSLRSALLLERCFIDSLEHRRREADDVVALAERLGDRHALLEAETVRQVVLWHPRYTEELLDRVPRLAADARELGRLDVPVHLHCTAFGYAIELNRRAALEDQLRAADAAAERLRTPIHRIRVVALRICRELVLGNFADVRHRIDDALPMMVEVHTDLAVQLNALWTFLIAREQGRLADLRPTFEAIVVAAPSLPTARALLGEICARSADLDAAQAHLDVLAEQDFAGVHDDFGWLAVIAASATVAALIGDRRRCARLYDLLSPYAGRNVITGLAANDRPVSYALGLLASALGRPDDAVAHFTRAADDARDFGALPWEGHALCELGASMRRSGHRRAAREPLGRALEIAREFGGEALAQRAREELVASGARPRRPRAEGRASLTESELRVARLAAEGMTNRQIAQALFLTARTVETHLTHTYRKLDLTSRADLAAALSAGDD